jgi:hypothetical protein
MARQKKPADAVQFTRESAERVARVVRRAELSAPAASPLVFTRNAIASSPRSGKVFRVCTFTGAWSKNSAKVVTFRGITSTPNTAVAQNIFVSITGTTSTSTTKNCAIAKDGTAWYVIAAECS